MDAISQDERWKALMRGQVMSATINKFMTIIRLLDQKAQVMIFLNSILVPMCLNALEHVTFRNAAMVSIVTALVSILAAMICIYPKRRYRQSGDREFNLLHFNDIGHVSKDEYMEAFMPILNDPEKLAETVVHDLYDTSRHSIMPKYTWLKISYAVFSIGNILAICLVFIEV